MGKKRDPDRGEGARKAQTTWTASDKRSCVLLSVLFVALYAGYFWAFHSRIGPPAEWFLALLGAVFALVGLNSIWAFFASFFKRRGYTPQSPGAMRSQAGMGFLMFLGLHAILAPLFFLSGPKLSGQAREAAGESIESLVQDGQIAELEELLRKGVLSAKPADPSETSALFYTRDPAMVRLLLDHGADPDARDGDGDTLLMEAARGDDVELARVLIAAGADVNFVNEQWSSPTTAISDAIENGHEEIVRLLREAGARDDTVRAENGLPLPPGGGLPFEVCRRYLLAHHARDLETVRRLRVARAEPSAEAESASGESASEVDWETVQSVRPTEPLLLEGYFNSDEATVTVGGVAPPGFEVTWVFQLRRIEAEAPPLPTEAPPLPAEAPPAARLVDPARAESGEWRIVREWWKTS